MKAPALLAFGARSRLILAGRIAVLAMSGSVSAANATPSADDIQPALVASAACPSYALASATPRDLTREILGGAPSALDRVRLSQSGGAQADASEAPEPLRATLEILRRPLFPAARQLGSINFQISGSDDGCSLQSSARPKLDESAPSNFPESNDIASAFDSSLEMGTRAIAIKRTRFDARWEKVNKPASTRLMNAELQRAGAESGLEEAELLVRVNRWVNRQIAYRSDQQNYRQRDFWATAQQTLARGAGDCEDFAILKMHMLRAAGIDPKRMKLMLLRDLAANGDHAFLVVQTDRGSVVLDNTIDRVYRSAEAVAVRPVLSFGETGRWVHAYREELPTAMSVPAAGPTGV